MKVGVLLSGCGVYDGTEVHEAVLTLLALDQRNAESVCMAPDIPQHHVINHLDGSEMRETRNVLVESARIARGNILPLDRVSARDLHALMMPGGFGTAKNFTKWAFTGPEGEILPAVKQLVKDMVQSKKPIGTVCMSPTTVAKALEGSGIRAKLTVGTTEQKSPYDIEGISEGMRRAGAEPVMCPLEGMVVDEENRIVSTGCYMLEASVGQIYAAIDRVCAKVVELAGRPAR